MAAGKSNSGVFLSGSCASLPSFAESISTWEVSSYAANWHVTGYRKNNQCAEDDAQ